MYISRAGERETTYAPRYVIRQKTHYIVLCSAAHIDSHRMTPTRSISYTEAARSSTIGTRVRAAFERARSLFKDHQVTPIGPMLRAASSNSIVNIG